MIVKFDDEKERATVSLRADELLPQLQEKEHKDPQSKYYIYFSIAYILILLLLDYRLYILPL